MVLVANYYVLSWTEPTSPPPGGSISPLAGKWQDGVNSGDIYYNGGNVGIGTSTPQVELEVNGKIKGDLSENIYYKSKSLTGCDSGRVFVRCNPGDIVIGGGGYCGFCGAIARMESSYRSGNGWIVWCDENGNATADGGYAEVVCLKKN